MIVVHFERRECHLNDIHHMTGTVSDRSITADSLDDRAAAVVSLNSNMLSISGTMRQLS
jgi:hypothetical protein